MDYPVRLVVNQRGQLVVYPGVPKWIAEKAMEVCELAKKTRTPQKFGSIYLKDDTLTPEIRMLLGSIGDIYPDCQVGIEEIEE